MADRIDRTDLGVPNDPDPNNEVPEEWDEEVLEEVLEDLPEEDQQEPVPPS